MKYLVVSDIHGGMTSAKLIKELFTEEKIDKILLLGDVLYHGPRNDLPLDYNPKVVMNVLNEIEDSIISIKGNCDAEVDEMVLKFKLNNQLDLKINDLNAHLEHGHHLDMFEGKADIILSGHTHIPVLKKENGIIYLNPGSITLPKGGNPKTYAIWDEHKITIYTFDKEVFNQYEY